MYKSQYASTNKTAIAFLNRLAAHAIDESAPNNIPVTSEAYKNRIQETTKKANNVIRLYDKGLITEHEATKELMLIALL